MTDTIFSWETGVRPANSRPHYLDEAAETIRDDAIAQARQKLGAAQCRTGLDSLLRRPDFLGYFQHGLASGVVNVLAASDQAVHAVYTYDPSINPDNEAGACLPQDAAVHLIVVVAAPAAAVEALIAALDRALTASLKDLPSPRFAQRESLLVVSLVSLEDVRCGANCAGRWVGLFAAPLEIWRRE
ncbi:MAG TPA: hypothetical protein VJ754_08060 [Anaerolineae bacterium]|nr:hypothetical protein [Anaerolineae bacterium]